MSYIGKTPTPAPLTSSDISDGIIITDKLANNAVVTSKITDGTIATEDVANDAVTLAKMASGTDGNIISYDTSGNPVAVATGSSGQVLTSAGAGAIPSFQAAAGGVNTPAFFAYQTTSQSISNGSNVKITFNTELYDTDNKFASSRFTPTVAGTYVISAQVRTNSMSNSISCELILYKNGSVYAKSKDFAFDGDIPTWKMVHHVVMDTDDYVEIYFYNGDNGAVGSNNADKFCNFGAFKLIT